MAAAVVVAIGLLPGDARSQSTTLVHTTPVPSVRAVPLDAPVTVDGRLDEAVWRSAPAATEFRQSQPHEGEPATQRTEVRFANDAEALYVGARMYDDLGAAGVRTRLARRDATVDSDELTLVFDPYHDHLTRVEFKVNPSGVKYDAYGPGGAGMDASWDPVWEAATTVDEGGWTAEMRIPFSQLRFNPADEQVWGVQIERTIARLREFSQFSFTPRTQPGGIPRYGHLVGLSGIPTGKRLEILPYTVARAEYVDRQGNPFRDGAEYLGKFGVDLKYRLTSSLTLDATINPDFGQVEVDPAEVNLSAIETRYNEKRPFFIEGAELFSFGSGGGNTAFYTRRIGRAPQLAVPFGESDAPDATRILGAAKVTGRTADGWSVGILNAVTAREQARYLVVEGDIAREERFTVEPLTNYFVGRVRRDFRSGQSVVGAMFAAVNRDLESEALRQNLRSSAYTGGLDFRHEWAGRTWALNGFIAGSYVTGSKEAILATQLGSPWHYFGRPDADHLEVDLKATSLAGLSAQAILSHRIGRHWRTHLLAGTTTPGYEVNDLGFQYRADRIDAEAGVTYIDNIPGEFLRYWEVWGNVRNERNYAGESILEIAQVGAYMQHPSYWALHVRATHQGNSLDDRLTRGGPAARRPAKTGFQAELMSDRRKAVAFELDAYTERSVAGDRARGVALEVEIKPAERWNLSIGPRLDHNHLAAQYLGHRSDEHATDTYGARYLFVELDQTTLSLEGRLNVTLDPSLSLQVYVQPYISSAEFGPPSELRAPRTYDFLVYGRDIGTLEEGDGRYVVDPDGAGPAAPFTVAKPDFNLRSLRGNAVLRWEWRAGSTIYLAWQQDRSDIAAVGDFDFGRDRAALFGAPADNVFVLKVNYWLNP